MSEVDQYESRMECNFITCSISQVYHIMATADEK